MIHKSAPRDSIQSAGSFLTRTQRLLSDYERTLVIFDLSFAKVKTVAGNVSNAYQDYTFNVVIIMATVGRDDQIDDE